MLINTKPAMIATILAPVMAFESIVIDFLVPALPRIAGDFSVPPQIAQLCISLFLIGYGFSQLVMGSLSDRFGRRPLLLYSLGAVIVCHAAAALAENIEFLYLSRLILGLVGGACMAVSLAVIRDLYDRDRMNRVLARIYAICGLCSVVGALIGGWVVGEIGWRGNFWCLFAVAMACWAALFIGLPETRPAHTTVQSMADIIRRMRRLFGDQKFLRLCLGGALIYCNMLVFIAVMPFLYGDLFGLSSAQIGLAFAAVISGYTMGSVLCSRQKASVSAVALTAVLSIAVLALILFLDMQGAANLWSISAAYFLIIAGVGFMAPQVVSIARDPYPMMAGTASSLITFSGYMTCGVVGYIAAKFYDHSIWPTSIIMMACLVGALLLIAPLSRSVIPKHPKC